MDTPVRSVGRGIKDYIAVLMTAVFTHRERVLSGQKSTQDRLFSPGCNRMTLKCQKCTIQKHCKANNTD